ncbi:MAG TPA: PGF-pre-PGF domain-containing protein [Methanosarcina sp.]|nr:PGF-pre-PGF domain-containing protein [Methanosarcina sp.]
MLKRRILTLLLIACFFLITVPAVSGSEITVNPTSGTNAQIAINNAINSVASGATPSKPGFILLTAGTYNISAPIILQSNVVLKGAGDSTIIFANGSVCNSEERHGYITGLNVSNVELCNLQFQSTASRFSDGGHGEYRDCIVLKSANDCRVHDILFTRYLYNDGVQVFRSTNITIYNCRLYSSGHDGVAFFSDSENCRMSNCDVQIQTNTGIRIASGINCEVDHNTFSSGTAGSGWCCVQLQNTLRNVSVHHNIMHDFRGSDSSAGIGSRYARGSISIHDNVMWNVSPYMQIGSPANNTLGPDDQNVSNWVAKGYGYGSIEIILTSVNAFFTSSATSGNVPLNVQFTDTSRGTPTSWLWNFGDGSKSTDRNPIHTYSTEGIYTVTLTVSNKYGTDSNNAIITVLADSEESSHSSGGSSGGSAGGSPEPQSNVEAKEISQTFVNSGKPVKFDFPRNATPVVSVSFDSKKTAGKTTTIVEMLKGKSTLVTGLPSDEVYKYLNIWVGNSGFATLTNIENTVVSFKVDKSWIQDKKIDQSSITLNRYSDKKWNQLFASLSNEDSKYLYFTAKTPGFSPFAITGKSTEIAIQPATGNKTQSANNMQNNTGSKVANAKEIPEQKNNTSTPGFEIVCGITGLLAVFIHKRKKNDN